MKPEWQLHDDGSFDLVSSATVLKGCYPAIDSTSIRPTVISVKRTSHGGTIQYDIASGQLVLRFDLDGTSPTLQAELKGMTEAPHNISPVTNAIVKGANRFFRQSQTLGGPSGFVNLPSNEALESFTISAFLCENDATLTIAANDNSRFLQKSRLTRDSDNGELMRLDSSFLTERIPTNDGCLELPPLYFRSALDPWSGLRETSSAIGQTMEARTGQPTSYHWCSWYYLYQHQTENDLDEYLKGLNAIKPKVPLQTIQVDAGYFPSTGDWLDPWYRFPSGMQKALELIKKAGYRPGIWIAPLMVGNRSRLAAEHPDWLLCNLDGTPIVAWHSYGEGRLWGYRDEEIYQLDTSHPDAMEYLRKVFNTFHEWGAEFFKTDIISWGFRDSTEVKRHKPGKTSVEYMRDMMKMIREEIGDESFLLGCITPYMCALGYADAMRIAYDIGPSWQSMHNPQNMISESYAVQHFNNIWFQNDPDVILLRDFHIEYSDEEVRSLALWQGILGGSINTSAPLHKINRKRLDLWRFLQPGKGKWTARLPYYGKQGELLVAVREFDNAPGTAVLVFNPGDHRATKELHISGLAGKVEAFVYIWGPGQVESIGKCSSLMPILDAHESVLYYMVDEDIPPPPNLTLGGSLA